MSETSAAPSHTSTVPSLSSTVSLPAPTSETPRQRCSVPSRYTPSARRIVVALAEEAATAASALPSVGWASDGTRRVG
eukprot:scaffold81622_cov66-Phaeocystis_antarctica.AAC.1